MRITTILLTLLLQLLLPVFAACQAPDQETIPPTATPLPPVVRINATPTALSTPTATPAIMTVLTTTVSMQPFTLTLPTPWTVYYSPAADWADQVQSLQSQVPELAHYLQVLASQAPTTTFVVAWQSTAPSLTFLAASTPAADLSLQGYLAAVTEELEQSRLTMGSGIRIHSATLRYDLHQAHLPIAVVHYTLPYDALHDNTNAASTANDTAALHGYQAALMEPNGEQLLLLTFISHTVLADEFVPLVEAIVAAIDVTLKENP
ncbi:MAG: hypothetical protein KF832_14715 [Caldilineaceae bacterium]|nr:hypothetical protein [Caldilineaceae bacterium]